MKMPVEHIEMIQALGYTEVEARFLYIVATYSGYFTLRQFLFFTEARRGKRSSAFAQKLLRHGHATIREYMGTGSVFHLFSRLVYGRIEKDNLRNRRRHSFEYIRTRLILLDFVLENQQNDFLEGEEDKVRFFCENLAVPKEVLPAKLYEGAPGSRPTIRYFVDKYPLFVSQSLSASSTVAAFSYVDSGSASGANFAAHLAVYQRLFGCLPAFRFFYIASRPAGFLAAEKRFRSIVQQPLESDVSKEVLRYFCIRKKWERHEYIVPVTEDLEFLSDARRRFHGPRFEALYRGWEAGHLDDHAVRGEFAQLTPGKKIWFETYLVRSPQSPIDEKHRKHVNAA
jgi:hypothetical protein